MPRWDKKPRLVVNAQLTHEIHRGLLARWRRDLPGRHLNILSPDHEFMRLLGLVVRDGFSVIEFSRHRYKSARWYEPVDQLRDESKLDYLGVIQARYVRDFDPWERGTLPRTRSGHRPTLIYRRKEGGADLGAMRDLLRDANPLYHAP